ncbi:hypothetical protein L227DRAFT_212804 [Lentinus tigrinus ALCF2SS1-6]|uniref:Uncharacterized protein n=1 Tax=Lentinus tigrinus ALCF2SS1-6 TaxID=1328759 RepID=A0A5C2SNS7_9APHY|nr:hypothetical protein L227DRAFT_212804 [Lentinus tigrinus ALCF2SS1-6]
MTYVRSAARYTAQISASRTIQHPSRCSVMVQRERNKEIVHIIRELHEYTVQSPTGRTRICTKGTAATISPANYLRRHAHGKSAPREERLGLQVCAHRYNTTTAPLSRRKTRAQTHGTGESGGRRGDEGEDERRKGRVRSFLCCLHYGDDDDDNDDGDGNADDDPHLG